MNKLIYFTIILLFINIQNINSQDSKRYRQDMELAGYNIAFGVISSTVGGIINKPNAFIFSLRKMKVKEIKIHWEGMDDFWAVYNWDFTDIDDIRGWEPDLNVLEVKIPEHEKVVSDIKKRVAKAEKEKKSHFAIYFFDFDFYLIY